MTFSHPPHALGLAQRARPLRSSSLATALAVSLAAPWPALAQSGTKDREPAQAAALPTVTVTGEKATATTQDTHSYTTGETAAATRLPLSLRETPQSVSVVTRQRMDDQQLHSVQEALQATTGLSARTLDSERVGFYARGFSISSLQYDGIPTTFLDGASLLDTAFYDRIEVVRGATGLLTGAGNPGASVNLVRKRPGKAFAASASLSAGSWNHVRGMADLSTPLTADGRIRARLVGVYQDRDSYIDLYQQKKKALYGVIDADLSADTTLSLGFDYQDITPRGTTWGGVPLWFSDGTRAEWPRSKTLAARWSRWDNTLKTAFANLEHRWDNGWTLRAAFNQQRTDAEARLFSGLGYPDRVTGQGLRPVALASDGGTRQNSFDAMATGPFQLFGRRHEMVVGAMASRRTADDRSTGFLFPGTPIANYHDWSGDYPQPDFANARYAATRTVTRQSGFYGAARLSLADPLKLIIGGRFSNYAIDEESQGTNFRDKTSSKFTPYAGLVYELSNTHSVYASYTQIFNPQTSRDRDNRVLKPTTGKNAEVGLKGEYLDGRVNAAVALFETRLDNVAQVDADYLLPNGTQAYYAANGTRSRGVDFDLQGEPSRGWNLYAGLSHFTAADAQGARLSTQLPRTTARLFTTYRMSGPWRQLTLGGGLTWQSRFYQAARGPGGAATAEQKSYALVSLMARYALTEQVDVSIHIDNLFDRKYAVMNGFYNQMLYGRPRNVTVMLDYRL